MKVMVTGTTGMVGKGVLLECLEHSNISGVLSISRRTLNMTHPKLKELIHQDFSEFRSVSRHLEGYDACYACMGVSSAGMKETEYSRLTYEFTFTLALELYTINPEMILTYVSGKGTDSSEKGGIMWARVKGKTENDLMKMGFRDTYMFRPGAIIPVKGVVPSSKLYRILITNLSWLIRLMKKIKPHSVVNSAQIGQAMINISQNGFHKNILDPKDILVLAKGNIENHYNL